MDKRIDNLSVLDQGKSESLDLGGRRVLVPDSLPSSSYVGLAKVEEEDIDSSYSKPANASVSLKTPLDKCNLGNQEALSIISDTPEDIFKVLETLLDLGNENTFSSKRMHLAIDTILTYVNDLSTVIDKLNSARKYILAKVNRQDEQIEVLQDEINYLKNIYQKMNLLRIV